MVCEVYGAVEVGEDDALHDLGCRGKEGDGSVACTLVRLFARFQEGNYSSDFPDGRNFGLVYDIVVKTNALSLLPLRSMTSKWPS